MVPKAFNLCGTKWRVVEVEGLAELGHCERDKATIRLRSGMDPQIRQSTFCHELIHAMWFMLGKTEHDEREVDAMGHLLHQYLATCKGRP